MSNTESTRPQHVLETDPKVKRVYNRTFIDEPLLLVSGAGSARYGTRSKQVRRQSSKARRRHAKFSLREALRINPTDTDTIDIVPIAKEKRSVSWRHRGANEVKATPVAA